MIQFTPDLMTNVAKIDEQHKELFNRLNTVIQLGGKSYGKEETEKTLDFLGQYIIKHFAEEEYLQRRSNYSKYDWHKGQHQQYVNEFQRLKAEYLKRGISPMFTLQLHNYMIKWIVRHIKNDDVEFGRHINMQN